MNFVGSLAYGAANLVWNTATLPAQIVFGERKKGDALTQVRGSTAPCVALLRWVCLYCSALAAHKGRSAVQQRGPCA